MSIPKTVTVQVSLLDVIHFLIKEHGGRTVKGLSEAIFGDRRSYHSVIGKLHQLQNHGLIEHRGKGIEGDPYRYYLKGKSPKDE